MNRLEKQREKSAMKQAHKLHKEMMRTDPDYKAKWEAMQNAIGDLLCDPDLDLKD